MAKLYITRKLIKFDGLNEEVAVFDYDEEELGELTNVRRFNDQFIEALFVRYEYERTEPLGLTTAETDFLGLVADNIVRHALLEEE